MPTTLGQVLTSAWRRMGTKPNDPEYPREQMALYANLALGELHSDCAKLAGGDVLLIAGRAIVATDDRLYEFAQQSPAITSVLQVRRVRLANRDNVRLRPVTMESLDVADGYGYALTGPDSAIVLHASLGVGVRDGLLIDYTEGPPTLSADNDVLPPWFPEQYRDVLELMVADAALAQGGESTIVQRQLDRLEDRRAQLWTHWSSRSPGAARRRDDT